MGCDGTGMNCYGMGWDEREKYDPWASMVIKQFLLHFFQINFGLRRVLPYFNTVKSEFFKMRKNIK